MEDSILLTVKKMLGFEPDYDAFDEDILVHINSAFMTLRELGVGPKKGFHVTGKDEVWQQFIPNDEMIHAAKQYLYLKVKPVFDPASTSAVNKSMDELCRELEWRLNSLAEEGEAYGSE